MKILILINEIRLQKLLWLKPLFILNMRLFRKPSILWIKTLLRLTFNTFFPGENCISFEFLILRSLGRSKLFFIKHLFNTSCKFCKIICYMFDSWLWWLFNYLQNFYFRIKIFIFIRLCLILIVCIELNFVFFNF